jgi:hypothetical protein
MHEINAANQQFPSATLLNLFPAKPAVGEADGPKEPAQRLRIVDNLVSITRRSWAKPFDTFGDFAA